MRGRVSLCFDDGMDCHVELVMPELERRGMKATFFVPIHPFDLSFDPPKPFSRFSRFRSAAWHDAAALGHEIGAHLVKHCSREVMDVWNAGVAEFEVDHAKQIIFAATGKPVDSMAYVKGHVTPTIREAVMKAHKQARGVAHGEGIPRGWTGDWYDIPTVCIGGKWDRTKELGMFLDNAVTHDLWVNLTFHGVGDVEMFGNVGWAQFISILNSIEARNVPVETFGAAADLWR
jgi:peptidoglycan/xylan/chitin deacetylase (PgdA/CDA1 family)